MDRCSCTVEPVLGWQSGVCPCGNACILDGHGTVQVWEIPLRIAGYVQSWLAQRTLDLFLSLDLQCLTESANKFSCRYSG